MVGDSVWDLLAARRASALGIGLLSGGYGREELIYAGAFRVYEDPGDLLAHLDEVGVRAPAVTGYADFNRRQLGRARPRPRRVARLRV